MKKQIRNTSITTRYLFLFKLIGYLFFLVSLVLFLYLFFYLLDKNVYSNYFLLFYLYYFYLWWNTIRRTFRVEFDDEYLYVIMRKQDYLIPLSNIKDVTLVSFLGLYRIDLFNKETFGNILYFKPSLVYPFNFKKKDDLIFSTFWTAIVNARNDNAILKRELPGL